jgi:hypothetical protein
VPNPLAQLLSVLSARNPTLPEPPLDFGGRPATPLSIDGLIGLLQPGNVDLYAQPEVDNHDGTKSTVDSSSYNIDGFEMLLPSVTPDGRHLRKADDIVREYQRTGRHLGQFDTPENASAYASRLHEDYAAGRFRRPEQK